MMTWQRKPYHILWVDDDPFFLNWITPQLTASCFIIHTFNDARAALAYLKRAHPDIVLTNLVMPYMSGLEMIAAIRRENQRIPIVVVSNRFQDGERQAAFRAGADSFLCKAGITGEVIMTAIRPYLEQ